MVKIVNNYWNELVAEETNPLEKTFLGAILSTKMPSSKARHLNAGSSKEKHLEHFVVSSVIIREYPKANLGFLVPWALSIFLALKRPVTEYSVPQCIEGRTIIRFNSS
jgi:hypothetical protein